MTDPLRENKRKETPFVGEISSPYFSPNITKGLVEFIVHPLQGKALLNNAAQVISISGVVYPVTVRGTGRVRPASSALTLWHPEDFLARIDGITFEQAHDMQKIRQEYVKEGTPFMGGIIEVKKSSKESDWLELRVRPQPYFSLSRKDAQLLTTSGEAFPVIIRHTEAAPASPVLGRFGDLIISLEGITFEQASQAQTLLQEQVYE